MSVPTNSHHISAGRPSSDGQLVPRGFQTRSTGQGRLPRNRSASLHDSLLLAFVLDVGDISVRRKRHLPRQRRSSLVLHTTID